MMLAAAAAVAEEIDIVIVGGGIGGLATALALHRKGIKSVVLERANALRATGAAITILPNGWRALHQLGLDSTLQSTAIPFERAIDVYADKGVVQESLASDGEARCIRRSDLIEALANALPLGTIRFGVQVLYVNMDRSSSYPLLQLHDGSLIKAKVLIGCDGAKSVIANYIGLKPAHLFTCTSVRGVTIYPNGHGYTPRFLRLRKEKLLVGRIPMDENTVYWFVALPEFLRDEAEMRKNPVSIRKMLLDRTSGFPKDIVEMLENSDLSSLSLTRVWYRPPWELLSGNFRRDTITVAGDAWHVIGPFIGQGGCSALEDAIVLARCLSKKIISNNAHLNASCEQFSAQKVMEALDEYLRERKRRVLMVSTLSYITGVLLIKNPSFPLKFLCVIIMVVLFRDGVDHTRFDCGEL